MCGKVDRCAQNALLAAGGGLNPFILIAVLAAAAILGDSLNYRIGTYFGTRLLRSKKCLIDRRHVETTRQYYRRYGKNTIILARFVPGVRSIAPFVAGIVRMDYPVFLSYNVVGGFLWVCGFVLFGYLVASLPMFKERQEFFLWAILCHSFGILFLMLYNIRKNLKGCAVYGEELPPLQVWTSDDASGVFSVPMSGTPGLERELPGNEATLCRFPRFCVFSRGGAEGTIGKLIQDPEVYEAIRRTTADLSTMTARINAGEGPLGRLLRDDALGQSLSTTARNVEELTGKISRGEGTAGKLVNDPALYDRLNGLSQKLDQLAARLNAGEGTAGKLLQDQQLYENMNNAVSDVRLLIADIRRERKKYLNIKVSLF